MGKRGFNIKGVFTKYTKDLGVKVDTAINKYTHKQKDEDDGSVYDKLSGVDGIKKGYIELGIVSITREVTDDDKDVIRDFIKSEFDLCEDGVITIRGYNALKKLYKNQEVDELSNDELLDVLDYINSKSKGDLTSELDKLDELYIELGFNDGDSGDDEELDLTCLDDDDEWIDWDDELIGFDDDFFDWGDDPIDWD